MIYTSYFSNLRHMPLNIIPISISLFAPKWYSGLEYKKLAPTIEIFRRWKDGYRIISPDRRQKEYNKQVLSKLSVDEVIFDISEIAKFDNLKWYEISDVVLLCYESTGFCHRHIVSEWLMSNDICVQEYPR